MYRENILFLDRMAVNRRQDSAYSATSFFTNFFKMNFLPHPLLSDHHHLVGVSGRSV